MPKNLALHTCCAPCLIGVYNALEGEHVTAIYYNPNIAPREEYVRRRDSCKQYAEDNNIDFVELPYDPKEWDRATQNGTLPQPERCRACYKLRLERAAKWAHENSCDALATTLTISPYQDQEAIAQSAPPLYVPHDFSPHFRAAQERAKELGLYRQNYCGCLPSKVRR
jgi:predicted adenine nucleotide alpha hydrolase (AANH) superfamily ATPase